MYDLFTRLTEGCPPLTPWPLFRAKYPDDIDRARTEYHAQPAVKALDADPDHMFAGLDLEDFLVSREQYVQTARDRAVTTFAVVMDGRWYERGKMGCWATVSDEKPAVKWVEQFDQMLDSLADSVLLTLVDAHI